MDTNQIAVSNDDAIIESALKILESRLLYDPESIPMTSPQASKDFVKLKLFAYEHEVFACLFLDNRNRVIGFDELFRGTIDSASVYPREVVKACLSHNAASVILAHNHPSGVSEPSQADIAITERLRKALALIDVRVLDHLIVGEEVTSFAERGLL
jgi:DNA repair protein RadC|tara:strand:- start:24 stop:491 length:468 start_codon:yes stop_codon:yes gene_type:complete